MLLNCGIGEDSWGVPWTARRSNQSTLKEINPEYSLEGLMLKLQHFGRLMWRVDSLQKTRMLGKIEGGKRRGWQDEIVGWHHQLNGHESEHSLGEGQGSLACYRVHGVVKSWIQLSNWTSNNIAVDQVSSNILPLLYLLRFLSLFSSSLSGFKW